MEHKCLFLVWGAVSPLIEKEPWYKDAHVQLYYSSIENDLIVIKK